MNIVKIKYSDIILTKLVQQVILKKSILYMIFFDIIVWFVCFYWAMPVGVRYAMDQI